MNRPTPLALAIFVALQSMAHAQGTPSAPELPTVEVNASADASAQGLSPAYAGGQVARGGRVGILGTRDPQETPFSITAYTNELIQDKQARSVGEVLQNDSGVRMARGFGNFQEAYFIRGFVVGSDDVAYNGLYSLLPRQYIATELFER
ncbi:TonB-dependent receptor plug domain-containing protein, partial [Diaphorobacter nitroreducens]